MGVADIRADDNFFALGGHSLLAVQAHRDIKVALGGGSLTITDIFRFPTLGALAAHLDKGQGARTPKRAAASPERTANAAPLARHAAPVLSPQIIDIVNKRRAMRAARSKSDA